MIWGRFGYGGKRNVVDTWRSFGRCGVVNHPVDIGIVWLVQSEQPIARDRLNGALVPPLMLLHMTASECEVRSFRVPAGGYIVPTPRAHIHAAEKEEAVVDTVLMLLKQDECCGRTWPQKVFRLVKMVRSRRIAETRYLASFVRWVAHIFIHRIAAHAGIPFTAETCVGLIGWAFELCGLLRIRFQ